MQPLVTEQAQHWPPVPPADPHANQRTAAPAVPVLKGCTPVTEPLDAPQFTGNADVHACVQWKWPEPTREN